MPPLRVVAPLAATLLLSGCGWIHFGRLPAQRASDSALSNAYTDLSIQHKILKEELALARRETATLRSALERSGSIAAPGDSSALARQLEETNRALAALREKYAALEASRPAAPTLDGAAPAAAELQAENARLTRELQASQAENASLAERLTESVARQEEAQITLSQLNSELLAQKQARERAEQATRALRAQLEAVMARAGRADSIASPPAQTAAGEAQPADPAPSAGGTAFAALRDAREPPSEAVPVVELRTSLARAQSSGVATPRPPIVLGRNDPPTPSSRDGVSTPSTPQLTRPETPPAPPPSAPATAASSTTRTHRVQAGDTLEKLSRQYYGVPDQWNKIYDANAETLATGLKAGMELSIPE